jgi:hypothetical protein
MEKQWFYNQDTEEENEITMKLLFPPFQLGIINPRFRISATVNVNLQR